MHLYWPLREFLAENPIFSAENLKVAIAQNRWFLIKRNPNGHSEPLRIKKRQFLAEKWLILMQMADYYYLLLEFDQRWTF